MEEEQMEKESEKNLHENWKCAFLFTVFSEANPKKESFTQWEILQLSK